MSMRHVGTIPPVFTAEYLNDAEKQIHDLYRQSMESFTVPSRQVDIYELASRYVRGAIGRVGLQFSMTSERCPIDNTLVPLKGSVIVYDDVLSSSMTYDYNPGLTGDVWMHRLSELPSHKAKPITTPNVVGKITSHLHTTRGLDSIIDEPSPLSVDFMRALADFSHLRKAKRQQATEYSVPLPTKSVRAKNKNDATATLSIKTTNMRLTNLRIDVASFHELEDSNALRVIGMEDKIHPTTSKHSVSSSLSLYSDGPVSPALIHAEKTDSWNLHRQMRMGSQALLRALSNNHE